MYRYYLWPERSYYSLTPLLDTVIIEVKALNLRGNPWRLYRTKYLPSQNDDTGFYSDQTT